MLDPKSLSKESFSFVRVLKLRPKDVKPVCLLEIGGEKLILKAGASGAYGEMADHLVNTNLINLAGMQGVNAPLAMELTDQNRAALLAKLKTLNLKGLAGDFDLEEQLSKALQPGEKGVISTVAPGRAVADFLDSGSRELMEKSLGAIQRSKDSASAVKALKPILLSKLDDVFKRNHRALLANLENSDAETRLKAIKDLNPGPGAPSARQVLLWMTRVHNNDLKEVAQSLSNALTELAAQQKPLIDHVKTELGASALGAMTTMDLIVGMGDRMVQFFGGTNFYFDPNKRTFWCIDNAKTGENSLSAPDEGEWRTFVIKSAKMIDSYSDSSTDKGKSFAEIFHWTAYDRRIQEPNDFNHNFKLSDQERYDTANAMRDAVTATLKKMRYIVDDPNNGLNPNLRQRLRSRLDFIDARNQLTSLLDFREFSVIPTVKNPWFGQKLLRIVGRKFVNATDEQTKAEAWKKIARNPPTKDTDKEAYDKVLADQDAEICDYLAQPQNLNPDQRVLKALFATRAARLIRVLETRGSYEVSDKINALAATNKAWGTFDPSLRTSFLTISSQWAKTLTDNGDPETARLLTDAMTGYLNKFYDRLT